MDGYDNSIDLKSGRLAYPLDVPDGSVDELRASHIFEHFSHRIALDVLKDWVRCLKPGGLLKLAVPDFEKIARGYIAGHQANWTGYTCGGHVDENDVHLAIYDQMSLGALMRSAGLSGIHLWKDGGADCSTLPVSLNLAGWKTPPIPRIAAIMSMPRLAFTDNMFSAIEVVAKLRIPIQKVTGVFWGQCLTRAMEEAIAYGAEWILTLDYDSVYDASTVQDLITTAVMTEVDAVMPLQMHRASGNPLLTIIGPDGGPVGRVDRSVLDQTVVKVNTGHFGCTMLRASKIASLPKPWFMPSPDPNGGWGEGRIDDDISFWQAWKQAGLSLHLAPRIVVGHAELHVLWPDQNLEQINQRPTDYWKDGPPGETWR